MPVPVSPVKSHTFNGRKVHLTVDRHVQGYVIFIEGKEKEMYVDPHLKGLAHLDTAIHEAIHACFPLETEKVVDRSATDIARFLWRLGYRRV